MKKNIDFHYSQKNAIKSEKTTEKRSKILKLIKKKSVKLASFIQIFNEQVIIRRNLKQFKLVIDVSNESSTNIDRFDVFNSEIDCSFATIDKFSIDLEAFTDEGFLNKENVQLISVGDQYCRTMEEILYCTKGLKTICTNAWNKYIENEDLLNVYNSSSSSLYERGKIFILSQSRNRNLEIFLMGCSFLLPMGYKFERIDKTRNELRLIGYLPHTDVNKCFDERWDCFMDSEN